MTAGSDEFPGDDPDAPPPLEPNLTDINAHLYSLFHPDFVMPYPDAWIEIAIANPKGGDGNTGPKASKHFSAFELKEAAEYAAKRNNRGNNVYIGMALRQGETGPSGRATKKNVITAARAWADFDKAGDAAQGPDLPVSKEAPGDRGRHDRHDPAPAATAVLQARRSATPDETGSRQRGDEDIARRQRRRRPEL